MDDTVQPKLHPNEEKAVQEHARRLLEYRRSIRTFILHMWGLTPQPVRPEFAEKWDEVQRATGETWERLKKTVDAEWFGYPIDPNNRGGEWMWYTRDGFVQGRSEFLKRKHFSWQQNIILLGVEKAVAGDAKRFLSTVSGHGIGKSATCSWIILWFLWCFFDSQVPVTAPTSAQMHDVLWKELSIWITRMPKEAQDLYEWQHDYIRINYSPETWFARARTSTKENTEAIAGVHADHVAIVVDEASGVPQQVFDTAEGALTSGNVFLIMISNGTRTIGYFYDSQHNLKHEFQTFQFNGEESPLVDRDFIKLKARHGLESEEYKIRVKGGFPGEDMMDDSGYLQLIPETKIIVRPKEKDPGFLAGRKILGVDPSGEGKDLCTFVLRDRFKAECVQKLQTTNDREIAEMILTLIDRYEIHPNDVVVGAFGVGSDVGKEIALATQGEFEIYTVMEGNSPQAEEEYNKRFFERLPEEFQNPEGTYKYKGAASVHDRPKYIDMYLNIRALMYFRARTWLINGGVLVDHSSESSPFRDEMAVIRYKRTLQGNKIQLMSKKEMLKLGIKSPNIADAFALTHLRSLDSGIKTKKEQDEEEQLRQEEEEMTSDERHSVL